MKIKSLDVSSRECYNGSCVIAIGLMQLLKTKYRKVAFFRPIIEDSAKKDNNIMTIKQYFLLHIPYNLSSTEYHSHKSLKIGNIFKTSESIPKFYFECLRR